MNGVDANRAEARVDARAVVVAADEAGGDSRCFVTDLLLVNAPRHKGERIE